MVKNFVLMNHDEELHKAWADKCMVVAHDFAE